MSARVRTGIASPYSFAWRVRPQDLPGDTPPDLSLVESASVEVRGPERVETIWSVSIASAETGLLVVRHLFAAEGTDITRKGRWSSYVLATIGSDTFRSRVFPFDAVGKWD